MNEYTHDSTPEERERLEAEIRDCKLACAELTRSLEVAQAELTALEEGSAALRELVAVRVEDLHRRVRGLRERVTGQAQAVTSLVQTIAAGCDAAASAYSASISSLHQSLESLRARIEQSHAHVERKSQSALGMAVAVANLFGQQLTGMEDAIKACIRFVDGQLGSHVDRHSEAVEEYASSLQSEANQAVHRIVADALEAHQQFATNALTRKRAALENLASQLRSALTGINASFDTLQAAQLRNLAGALEETDRSLKGAMNAVTSTVGDFTKTASQVSEALETTQSGLRVLVGSLERALRVLEAVETL